MIKRVGIVAKPRLTAVSKDLPAIASWLAQRGVEPVFDEATADLAAQAGLRRVTRDDLPRHVDLILLLGGDGTLLGMADRVAAAGLQVPILGVNFGGLGFLTEVTYRELYASLEAALAGTAPVESRLMLKAVIERDGQPRAEHYVLNDVTVTGGSLSRVVEFAVSVGGEFVARFHADGIIVVDAHRVDRVQLVGRRPHRAPRRARARAESDRSAHAHEQARGHSRVGRRPRAASPAR